MRLALALALISLAASTACSDGNALPSTPDSGVAPASDAGEQVDSGVIGGSDAAVGQDGSGVDSGVMDNCDPLAQSGCTAPATKCVIEPDALNAGAHCVPPGNDQMLGDPCSGEDCQAGLACVATSTASSCVQICNIATGAGCESLGMDYDCRTRVLGTNWGACSLLPPICDPLTQMPCEPTQACSTFQRRNGIRELRCREAGPQGESAACGSSANGMGCMRNLVCILNSTTMMASCKRFCDTNDDCTAPQTCVGVVNDPPFQFCDQ